MKSTAFSALLLKTKIDIALNFHLEGHASLHAAFEKPPNAHLHGRMPPRICRKRALPICACKLSAVFKTNSIIMRAPKKSIFETAANLELWPKILPHYRYIHYLERGADRNVVVMAATRSGIPISWTSEQIIDRDRVEVRFHHLKAFTKGMRVVWTFKETQEGVLVEIAHDLRFRVRFLAPFADKIIGDFFIHNIANKTLHCMKAYVEGQPKPVTA
jgi:ribosome-associated toxin RatA of RatAB toxin-antitoxin module